jgi:mannosyltransferase
MKIIYDNIIFSIQKSGGISVVWYELIKRLLNEKSVVTEFIEYSNCNDNIFRKNLDIASINKKTRKQNKFKRYFNPKVTEENDFIFHSSYYRISKNKRAINITTVHDFTYELYRKGIRKWIHSYQKFRAIKHSDYIICVSENTKKDLLSFLPDINPNKVYVIHNGVSENYFPLSNPYIFEFKNIRPYEYVIFIGLRDDYKRFDFAVNLSHRLNKRLVIVGGGDLNKSELAFLDSNIKTYLHFSRPSDSELNTLYNFAYCLIYPSEYEGFGIPIIEAQRAGCPVIAYNCGAIKEVAGNNPLLFDTFDPETIAQKTENYLSDATKREKIVSDGIENAAKYSWDYTYSETLELYKSAMSAKKH